MNGQASSRSNITHPISVFAMAIVTVARTGFAVFLALAFRSIAIPLPLQADEVTLTSSDRVAKLAKALESGKAKLEEDEKWGLLPSLLKALSIPEESQCLVFSKTSFQPLKISLERPRAIYFNDDCYVGWVQESRLIEIGAASPEMGAAFYTLDAERFEKPVIRSDRGQCLVCHDNQRTKAVPGFLVRSVYVSSSERFVRDSPALVTDHRSPFHQRWGGWYVTGSDGKQPHLGNTVNQGGLNQSQASPTQLKIPQAVVSGAYLRSSSDIVALMVLEHQTQMHNHFSRVNRAAKELKAMTTSTDSMPQADHPDRLVFEERLSRYSEELTQYLLMSDEFKLESAVIGDSLFTESFSQRKPQDRFGRSLFQLDLQTRLFRYPCSYLIYSDVFESMEPLAKMAIGKNLERVLISQQTVAGYEDISDDDRRAIVSILRETKPSFWNEYVEPHSM